MSTEEIILIMYLQYDTTVNTKLVKITPLTISKTNPVP